MNIFKKAHPSIKAKKSVNKLDLIEKKIGKDYGSGSIKDVSILMEDAGYTSLSQFLKNVPQ